MKESTRQQLIKFQGALEGASGKVADLREMLSGIIDEMQDEYDSKSENWQESDAGEELSNQIDEWRDTLSPLEDADSSLEEASNNSPNLEG